MDIGGLEVVETGRRLLTAEDVAELDSYMSKEVLESALDIMREVVSDG